MKSFIRTTDSVGRWGGEEFVITLPNSNINDTLQLAERMRVQISELHFELGISLTCSFGITEYKSGDKTEEIIKRIDNALYKAKEKRNASYVL
jgi:diguanylate cyclase (GGDEF)-like protein